MDKIGLRIPFFPAPWPWGAEGLALALEIRRPAGEKRASSGGRTVTIFLSHSWPAIPAGSFSSKRRGFQPRRGICPQAESCL